MVADTTPEARRETTEPLESGLECEGFLAFLWSRNLAPVGFHEGRVVSKKTMQFNVNP